MYLPLVGEYVRLGGHKEVFAVVRAHYKRELADVVGVDSNAELNGIPFESLFACSDESARSKSHLYQG